MSFDSLAGSINRICVRVFGQTVTFTPQTPGAAPITINGVMDPGAELEAEAPGDGSVNAVLFVHAEDISPIPVNGDEIATATTIYKIVQVLQDKGEGLALHLRQDRMVT